MVSGGPPRRCVQVTRLCANVRYLREGEGWFRRKGVVAEIPLRCAFALGRDFAVRRPRNPTFAPQELRRRQLAALVAWLLAARSQPVVLALEDFDVAELDELALQASLERLAEADLLFVEGAPPQSAYRFKHALIQDAAYDSLLKSRRQALHWLACTKSCETGRSTTNGRARSDRPSFHQSQP